MEGLKQKLIRSSSILLSTFALAATTAQARDFMLEELPESENRFSLPRACGGETYYTFMQDVLGPRMLEVAENLSGTPNEEALRNGEGIAVKLDANNHNFHVNFPNDPQGGRSYGWTEGQIGDWSDRMYLDFLSEVVAGEEDNLENFYEVVIRMLGNCSTAGLSDLSHEAQRVATNFLAIYTAEEYRRIVDTGLSWDDALLQVTLVAAVHGGQETHTMFYAGELTNQVPDQSTCGYFRDREGLRTRAARLNDYWQFGRKASAQFEARGRCTGSSGINITRRDFEAMGRLITAYERDVKESANLQAVESIVGSSPNFIKAVAKYFTTGKARAKDTNRLATKLAALMIEVREDAAEITASGQE